MEDPYSPRYCNCQRSFQATVSGWEGKTKDEAKVRTLINHSNSSVGRKELNLLFSIQPPQEAGFIFAKNAKK